MVLTPACVTFPTANLMSELFFFFGMHEWTNLSAIILTPGQPDGFVCHILTPGVSNMKVSLHTT
jgi:hypothetical protein